MMNNEDLKSCPCCKGKAEICKEYTYNSDVLCWIECNECGLQTEKYYYENRQEMINVWNKRPGDRDE